MVARQYSFHVSVQNRLPLPAGERENCAGRGTADTRQGDEIDHGVRQFSVEFLNDDRSRCMQVSGSSVVAETRPMGENIVARSRREIVDRRKSSNKSLEIRYYRGDLGLLQHDLGHPYRIRRSGTLPGKVVASMVVVPVQEPASE